MITAMEMRKQRFSKGLRGFKEEEVINYMSQVAVEFENLYTQNSLLKEEIQRLEFELRKYRSLEETMNNSLILAQQTAEELQKNARLEAQGILTASRRQAAELLIVYQDIIKRMNVFNAEIKGQVMAQNEMLEKNQRKIEELSKFFYGEDIKQILEKLEQV